VHRVADCISKRVRFAVPQPTEWQNIGNQIKTAMILTRLDFVGVRYRRRDHHDMVATNFRFRLGMNGTISPLRMAIAIRTADKIAAMPIAPIEDSSP
jgi:hypothetical protein